MLKEFNILFLIFSIMIVSCTSVTSIRKHNKDRFKLDKFSNAAAVVKGDVGHIRKKDSAHYMEIEKYIYSILGEDADIFYSDRMQKELEKKLDNKKYLLYLDFTTAYDENMTYILEALYIYPGLLIFPVPTPQWGYSTFNAKVKIMKDREMIYEYNAFSRHDYDMLFYSLFRSAPIESAFNQSFNDVISSIFYLQQSSKYWRFIPQKRGHL